MQSNFKIKKVVPLETPTVTRRISVKAKFTKKNCAKKNDNEEGVRM